MEENNITISIKDNDALVGVKDLINYITGLPANRRITVNFYIQSIGEIINSTVSGVNEMSNFLTNPK